MGTLRKMGAFLGLVPDESRDDGRDAEYAGYQEYADYSGNEYPDEHGYAVDEGIDHRAGIGSHPVGSQPVGYQPAGYTRSEFDHADLDELQHYGAGDRQALDNRADYRADYRAAEGSSPMAGHPDEQPVVEYADDRAVEYAHAGQSVAHPEPAARSARGGSRRGRVTEPADDYRTQGALAFQPEPDVRAEMSTEVFGAAGKPATVKLGGFGDARQVGETYREGQAVILDMTDLTDAEARRMVDFAAGLAFAVRGSIDKVTTKVFMLHPPESGGNSEAVGAGQTGR